MSMQPLGIAARTMTHALGTGVDSLWHAITTQQSGLRKNDLAWCELDCWLGASPEVDSVYLPDNLQIWDCRNHRLVWLAIQDLQFRETLERLKSKFGPSRVGLLMGTSTSGIRSTEIAYAERKASGQWPDTYSFQHTHSIDALCRFVSHTLGLRGPSAGLASACASSAKVFLTAQRWLEAGLVDAVLVGGADSLCLSTLHGFNALQLLSDEPCRPFDARRKGISIGEAAGFVLLTREQHGTHEVQFLGGGESNDAHHITAPHPEGQGARQAMVIALSAAKLQPHELHYINAHGTATPSNDRAEAAALEALLTDNKVPVSSTKGYTGHTLGAAGITEAILTIEALKRQVLPALCDMEEPDPGTTLNLIKICRPAKLDYAMSNNFGFGGINCSLIFGRGP